MLLGFLGLAFNIVLDHLKWKEPKSLTCTRLITSYKKMLSLSLGFQEIKITVWASVVFCEVLLNIILSTV